MGVLLTMPLVRNPEEAPLVGSGRPRGMRYAVTIGLAAAAVACCVLAALSYSGEDHEAYLYEEDGPQELEEGHAEFQSLKFKPYKPDYVNVFKKVTKSPKWRKYKPDYKNVFDKVIKSHKWRKYKPDYKNVLSKPLKEPSHPPFKTNYKNYKTDKNIYDEMEHAKAPHPFSKYVLDKNVLAKKIAKHKWKNTYKNYKTDKNVYRGMKFPSY